MARIAGVNIPTAKRVPIALTYITGIGPASAKAICEAVNIEATHNVLEECCISGVKRVVFATTSRKKVMSGSMIMVRKTLSG